MAHKLIKALVKEAIANKKAYQQRMIRVRDSSRRALRDALDQIDKVNMQLSELQSELEDL